MPVPPQPQDAELNRFLDMAFDHSKPAHYANIYYISGTVADLRIAFGTIRPTAHQSTEQTIDKFDVSITMPHDVAKDLADKILALLQRAP